MIKEFLSDARETYWEYRRMGMSHDDAAGQTASNMVDKLELRLPWAMTLYTDYKEHIDQYAPVAVQLDAVNKVGTPEVAFLTSLAFCLDRLILDHLERDDPMAVDILFEVTESTIEVVGWE